MFFQGARKNLLMAVVASAALAGCLEEDPRVAESGDVPADGLPTAAPPPPNTGNAADTNTAPVLEGTPASSVMAGTSYLFQPAARDAEGNAMQFSVTGLPAWARFDAARGEISGSPADTDAGVSADIILSVSDGTVTTSLPAFRITVEPRPAAPATPTPANRAPTISGNPSVSVQATTPYRFVPQAVDIDSGTLTYAIANKPSWAAFSSATGTLEGTPTAQQVAQYRSIVISVSDGQLSASLPAFSIQVTAAPNRAPVIAGTPAATARVGINYVFTPAARDDDGDTLRFSVTGLPAWLRLNTATGAIEGIPSDANTGAHAGITLSVSDGRQVAQLASFTITVSPAPNTAPTITGSPSTSVTVNRAYQFQPSGFDADGQTLRYSVSNLPAWAQFNTGTGAITGTPGTSQTGTFSNITISVTDGSATASLAAFSINVTTALNAPPVISGSPATRLTAGTAYSFTPQASDADGQPLTFSIQNRPAWASFNASTGALTGTPGTSHIGSSTNVLISVSDGAATASLPAFAIQVEAAPNRAPTISGSPATRMTAGNAYTFTPSAADADGNTLTFSIVGRPAWATFSTATGAITGTPSRAQAGNYAGITISVSDGQAVASLPGFAITVDSPPNTAPTLGGSPATSVNTGSDYAFTPTAADADGNSLTFTISGRPAWATFNPSTGQLSGRPSTADAGSYAGIVISVSDGTATTSLPAFGITVRAPVTGSATLNWTAPSQNDDGSALTNLAGYRIYSGPNASSLTLSSTIATPATTTATFSNLATGTYCYAVSAYTSGGSESDRTPAACKTIP